MSSVKMVVPPAVAVSTSEGPTTATQTLHLYVGLQPSNAAALQTYADAVSDPTNSLYRHYLTPAQFGTMFGQSPATVTSVANYLKGKGLTITRVGQNNMSIMATGTVAQAQSAFNVKINNFHYNNAPTGYRSDFYAFTSVPQMPTAIAPLVTHIGGLENSLKPIPLLKRNPKAYAAFRAALNAKAKQVGGQVLTPAQTHVLYNLAPLYNAGVQGQGRNVGVSGWDGYDLTNIPVFYKAFSLPTPTGGVGSNITVVSIDGGVGTVGEGEGDLDNQMVLGEAPLTHLTIYGSSGDLEDTLSTEVDDNVEDVITESYGWDLGASEAETCHSLHLQMTTQGITYVKASGDTGTDSGPYWYGDYDPDITVVGGTVASFTSAGVRQAEDGWGGFEGLGSGGGWTTSPATSFNVLPTWQKGNGVPTGINFRLFPDVALVAAGSNTSFIGAYYFVYGGTVTGDGVGTSFSSPVFAGGLAVAEQQLISLGAITQSSGTYRLGRINDRLYQQNGRSDVWFDVLTGNAGTLPNNQADVCTPGWDTVTGWGAVNWQGFVNSFAPPVTVGPSAVSIYASQGQAATGTVQSLDAVDGSFYTVSSVANTVGAVAGVEVTFKSPGAAANVLSLEFKVTVEAPSAVSNFLYVYDNTTKTYDLLTTTAMNGSEVSIALPLATVSKYISPGGQIFLVDRAVYPARLGSVPFKLKIDQAVLSATVAP